MKAIKVKIFGHPINDIYGYSYFILKKLQKYYIVELSETPDYVFYHDSTHDHYLYDSCVKIFYTGENISPNFNTCDYAIGFDYMTFEDRYYRLPLYLVTVFYNPDEVTLAGEYYLENTTKLTREDVHKKTEFCSFVYSNYRADRERKLMFNTLSTYKRVNSAGSYLNNTGGEKIKNKLEYEWKHKFSITFENSSRSGYTTEKLVSGLVAKTIPIYWGNPNIGKEFNTKRFINCHDYESFDAALAKVKELDSNDELYLSMVNEPIPAPGYNFREVHNGVDLFLQHIINQPLKEAYRRTINPIKAKEMVSNDRHIARNIRRQAFWLALMTGMYKPFKKIPIVEKIKHSFLNNN